MLGDALLVAPVFREDKVAQYYLPEGTWTELLTGETKEGGRWFQGTYDYFSMPLYVRENSIVVRGNCDTKPDYDYADHATVCVYQLKESIRRRCTYRTESRSIRRKREERGCTRGRCERSCSCIRAEKLHNGIT